MIVFIFLLYTVIGLVIGEMFNGVMGGVIGFVLGALIFKAASLLEHSIEREEEPF